MSEKELQPLVTQCPNCHTQFRVSESQLQIASGKVRCGACLTVFQGVDNLVWEEGQEPAEHGDLDELIDEIDAVAEVDDAPAPAPPADEEPAAASVQESKPPPKETLGGGVAVELSADSARDITLDDLEAELLGAPISRPASADDGPVPGAAPDIDLIPSEDLEAVKRRDRERTLADAAERLAARQAEPSA
ncbi:MAG: MJ0042-type zinc finger domain-containing protein, partial [Pseudomonadota bacterium]